MKILALDLSTARGSLAWLHPPSQFVRQWPNDRKNSAAFFTNLDAVIKRFGPPETIIVGLGPGSYAGTRIAISAATGLCLSGDARLLGYPSICAMECAASEYGVIGDARRKSFFFARVRENRLAEGPDLFSEAELNAKLEVVGQRSPFSARRHFRNLAESDCVFHPLRCWRDLRWSRSAAFLLRRWSRFTCAGRMSLLQNETGLPLLG